MTAQPVAQARIASTVALVTGAGWAYRAITTPGRVADPHEQPV